MTTRRPILLVVDDDEDVREALTAALEDDGFVVVTAENGAKALQIIASGLAPSLILLDLMMPVMNGWDFWDRHQASPTLRAIPVVFLTATGLSTGSVGNARVLPKPVDYATLLGVINSTALV